MIKQILNVNKYWRVIIYYNVNYNLFNYIANDLYKINIPKRIIKRIYKNMNFGNAKAVTISNIKLHISIVLFNKHNNKYDYLNSIVHEAEHIKQHMLEGYNVNDIGEPPAYTIGYLVMKMMMFYNVLNTN